jgi:hypothetical protein
MTGRAVPDFRHPDDVGIVGILRDDAGLAARHPVGTAPHTSNKLVAFACNSGNPVDLAKDGLNSPLSLRVRRPSLSIPIRKFGVVRQAARVMQAQGALPCSRRQHVNIWPR